ncbi:hypothetical protein ABZU86_32585 [Streptomyces sp. NPDC005271]|uniref:hypothetical protein n=1 Tax=unclassified Streptomyces TaxID=2593676 RepID=UPI0033B47009
MISFRAAPGRLVPDGFVHSGGVGTTEGGFLNLHEPGTVRAFLDAAMARGWDAKDPSAKETKETKEMDGWTLFDKVARRRSAGTPRSER